MLATSTVAEEILDLKRDRKAILLAHHYQEAEIQELADVVGDSLELARKAREPEGDVIAFCGVWFMAETAKVLNPSRIVVVPDKDASCSLVEGCPVEPIREYRRRNPDHVIVSYINTSIEVKAESRHSLHFAQRRQGRQFDSRRRRPSCSCPTATWATT